MMTKALLVLAGLAAVSGLSLPGYLTHQCAQGQYPPSQPQIDTYELDLDLSPRKRWKEIAAAKKDQIQAAIDTAVGLIKFVAGEKTVEELEVLFTGLWVEFEEEYRMEMLGISEATGISLGYITFLNAFYEAYKYEVPICTSIIAQTDDGQQIHGRNMDFGEFMGVDWKNREWKLTENLRDIVINVNATSGGRTVYQSVSYAGYIGVFTGFAKSRFSVTVDTRMGRSSGQDRFNQWVMGDSTLQFTTLLPRKLLQNGATFEEAVEQLSSQPMIVWEYYIVSGPNPGDGVVITRNVTTAVDQWTLDKDNGQWFLLETNYDHWNQAPFFDHRRTTGNKCMNQWDSSTIDKSKIYDVLSTNAVLNKGTVYTVLMNVATGNFESYVRDCSDCWLW